VKTHFLQGQGGVLIPKKVRYKCTRFVFVVNKIGAAEFGQAAWYSDTVETKEALSRFAHRYASDFNHMNMNGHQFLAEEIMKIVNRELDSYPANPRRGTWGEGDLCYSWYQTGIVPLQYASLVEIEQYDPRNEKYALSTCKVGLLLIILLIHPDI